VCVCVCVCVSVCVCGLDLSGSRQNPVPGYREHDNENFVFHKDKISWLSVQVTPSQKLLFPITKVFPALRTDLKWK
jgi:hypothetical protein